MFGNARSSLWEGSLLHPLSTVTASGSEEVTT
jgi:hypothetical protein